MKKPNSWQGAKKSTSFAGIEPGGYVCRIMNAQMHNENCLKISYDIAEGPFKDYYRKQYEQWGGTWRGNHYQSVESKDGSTVLAGFSNLIYCIEESNKGYVWDWDERKLKGKMLGIVMREEEYIPSSGAHAGEVRTIVKSDTILTVEDIRKGDFKVKECKRLQEGSKAQTQPDTFSSMQTVNINDDDIQF